MLTDGAAEPEVTFYNLYNVEQVEVLKGPGAFLYGGNPLSGTVNLRRKQPVFETFAHMSAAAGRFNTFRGLLDIGWGKEASDLAVRLNALWQRSDNYRDDKENDGVSINPAVTWRLGAGSALRFNFEYATSEYEPDSGLPVVNGKLADVPRSRSYQSPMDISDQNIYRARIDFEHRITERLIVRNKLYFTDLDWLSRGTLLIGPAFNQQGEIVPGRVGRTLSILDDRQKLAGNQLEATTEVSTGPVGHQLLVGVEISRLADEFALDVGLLPSLDIVEPLEPEGQPPFIISNQSGDARSLTWAPYLVDRIELSNRYHLFAGARFDAIDYEDDESGVTQNFNRFSPMLGFVYAPTAKWSFYANAGRAFAPPSTLGRGDRKAEESEQLEVGTKMVLFDGRVETSAAFYQLTKDVASDDGTTRRSGQQRARQDRMAEAVEQISNRLFPTPKRVPSVHRLAVGAEQENATASESDSCDSMQMVEDLQPSCNPPSVTGDIRKLLICIALRTETGDSPRFPWRKSP